MKHYNGEVHIILKDIDDTKRKGRNLVGKIAEEDFYKIKLLGSKKFKFTN